MHSKTIIGIANWVKPYCNKSYCNHIVPLNFEHSMRMSFKDPTTWEKFHTSSNLSDIFFQSFSGEGALRKSFKAANIALACWASILLLVVLPIQKLYDKDCCDSSKGKNKQRYKQTSFCW